MEASHTKVNRVFRETALKQLTSPDQLNVLMRITDVKGWLFLFGCWLLLGTAMGFCIWGRIPTRLPARGMLIPHGGLADVVSVGTGQITALTVEIGDYVQEGQAIASVGQPELREELHGLVSQLGELKANLARVKASGEQETSLREAASSKERVSLEAQLAANEQRARELEQRVQTLGSLVTQGLVSQEVLDATRDSLRSTEVAAEGLRASLRHLVVGSFAAERMNQALVTGDELRVQETERQIRVLKERLEQSSRVLSTHSGRVVEVRAMVGDIVTPGQPIVSLERAAERGKLEALLYVDSREGKILRKGMRVEVAPSIVRKERYGVIVGKVKSVESFPSTRQGMMRVLHNEQLVDTFISETGGAPIAVRAELVPAHDTPSGYLWSSGKGPDLSLTSGTRTLATITTRTQRPIALLFPALDDGR